MSVVVITGASAGVGRSTAIAFARNGAAVGLIARGRAGLEAARRDVEAAGGTAVICQADVADPEAVEAAAARIEETLGPIDIWVNNAMASVFSPVRDMTAAEFRRVMEVTYLGIVHGTLSALRRMLPRDAGVIIQVGSALAYRGIPLQSAYCAAKHAVQGFCESLRTELRHDGSRVRVVMVQLPAVNTPQFDWVKSRLPRRSQPIGPIFQPEVAARAILAAVDHDRPELFLGMPTITAAVGNTVAPRIADRYLAVAGYEGQQSSEPEDPDRPHNLWKPLDDERDYGAHGRFDEWARDRSIQLWAAQHRLAVALAGVTVAALVAALMRRSPATGRRA